MALLGVLTSSGRIYLVDSAGFINPELFRIFESKLDRPLQNRVGFSGPDSGPRASQPDAYQSI